MPVPPVLARPLRDQPPGGHRVAPQQGEGVDGYGVEPVVFLGLRDALPLDEHPASQVPHPTEIGRGYRLPHRNPGDASAAGGVGHRTRLSATTGMTRLVRPWYSPNTGLAATCNA